MQQILALRGAIQHYDWGSRTVLAELLGRPVPSPRPEAELWLGAHPHGQAEARVEGRWEPLGALIERAAEAVLGPSVHSLHGPRLPFLLKVLAVEQPLSLQAHPNAVQARAGFRRSRAAGDRTYPDPYPKPELLCALSPFRALCGFLPLPEVRERFAALGLPKLVPAGDDEPAVLRRFLGAWLGSPDDAHREAILGRALAAASRRASEDGAYALVGKLAEIHPDDPGVLAPLFLREIELAPGEALFLAPGALHAYLGGVGVELMGSSDNVLRAGLTRKPVHVTELLRVLRFASGSPPLVRPRPRSAGERVWSTPAGEFELSELSPREGLAVAVGERAGVEILCCVEGACRVQPQQGGGVELGRGESCLVPAVVGAYRVTGAARLFRAGLPLAEAPQEKRPARRRGAPCGS